MVTAETALALPVLVVLLAVVLSGIRYGIDQVRCLDAARAGARAAARGDSPAAVEAITLRGAPAAADVAVTSRAGLVTVDVRGAAPGAGLLTGLPRPHGRAVAQIEDPTGAGP